MAYESEQGEELFRKDAMLAEQCGACDFWMVKVIHVVHLFPFRKYTQCCKSP